MIRDINRRVIIKKRNYWEVYLVSDSLDEHKIWHSIDRQNATEARQWFQHAITWFARAWGRGGAVCDQLAEFIKVERTPSRFGVYMCNERGRKKVMYYADTEVKAETKARLYRHAVKQHVIAKRATGVEADRVVPDNTAETVAVSLPSDAHRSTPKPESPPEEQSRSGDSSKWYDATGKKRIEAPADLANFPKPCYVYVLCRPGSGPHFRPFYVGHGQGKRLFAHEDEARQGKSDTAKVDAIRAIWDRRGEVVRFIDGFYDHEPWNEEQILIARFGLLKDGSGILTNDNQYADSHIEDGVELRKFALVEIPAIGQDAVVARAGMSFAEDKPVPIRHAGVMRVDIHDAEIQRHKYLHLR